MIQRQEVVNDRGCDCVDLDSDDYDDDDDDVCRMIKAKWPKGRKNPTKKRSLLAPYNLPLICHS